MMWFTKYKPKKIEDLVVSEQTKKRFLKFMLEYSKEQKKALLLWGPVGIGKTLLPTVFAKQHSYDITELNASSERSKKIIQESLKNMATTASIFGNKKIILIDEVDCTSRSDYGALQAVIEAIKITRHPIILTAQNYWDQKISSLRKYVLGLEVKAAGTAEKEKFIKKILENEKTKYENASLRTLVEKSPDMRALLNDIESMHHAGGVTSENIDSMPLRDQTEAVKETVVKALNSKSMPEALKHLNNSDAEPSEIMNWIGENIAGTAENAKQYSKLSAADVISGRIMRRQNWRLLYYQKILIAGINSMNVSSVVYPELFKRLFIARAQRAKRDSISAKLSQQFHTSKKAFAKNYFPILKKMKREELEEMELEPEEISYLKSADRKLN